MAEVGAREKDLGDRMLWRSIIHYGKPWLKGKAKEEVSVETLKINSIVKLKCFCLCGERTIKFNISHRCANLFV